MVLNKYCLRNLLFILSENCHGVRKLCQVTTGFTWRHQIYLQLQFG